jgi:hypothetical protein
MRRSEQMIKNYQHREYHKQMDAKVNFQQEDFLPECQNDKYDFHLTIESSLLAEEYKNPSTINLIEMVFI